MKVGPRLVFGGMVGAEPKMVICRGVGCLMKDMVTMVVEKEEQGCGWHPSLQQTEVQTDMLAGARWARNSPGTGAMTTTSGHIERPWTRLESLMRHTDANQGDPPRSSPFSHLALLLLFCASGHSLSYPLVLEGAPSAMVADLSLETSASGGLPVVITHGALWRANQRSRARQRRLMSNTSAPRHR